MRKNYRILVLMLCAALLLSLGSVQTAFADTQDNGSDSAAEVVALKAPTGVKALSSGTRTIKVSWSKVSGAEQYQVYRYNSKTKAWKLAKTTAELSVKFTGLSKNTTYKYKVRALSGEQQSAFSASVTSKTGVATKISLNASSKTLYCGKTFQLKATVTAKAPSKSVKWSSSNSKVASVSSSGKVTAKSAGKATITAKAHNGATVTCKITVKEASFEQRYQDEMLRLVNEFRKENGVAPLTYASKIQSAADLRAQEAWKRPDLSHKRITKNGTEGRFYTVYEDLKLNVTYKNVGENLSWSSASFSTPEAAAKHYFDYWKDSAGHRANMLNKNFKSMATAYYYNSKTTSVAKYAGASVQLFLG